MGRRDALFAKFWITSGWARFFIIIMIDDIHALNPAQLHSVQLCLNNFSFQLIFILFTFNISNGTINY